ncbi:vacuolar protein sorting-associated protein 37B-like [Acanthaster planci]|uniref:Vacuolar protein sorting-associated protein 37B-like n=1 Tax=Acanthaster planci TaxID=133434 RepID=A0A8B7YJ71_ACAPL|nr:vacuolar protein sorting-associated protein 37B-like [Acanthaster planci]XP_022093298.1 vacuolar protein sorting-associated protein 37B-like [Acanthaster planci]XP_022093299.1 vacuolar protein sorting-associated protein 37B-like [Acanthaster planci]
MSSYSSHNYPYQIGSHQPPAQPPQYSSYTPQPTAHFPQPQLQYPQPPSFPTPSPSQPEPPRYPQHTPVDNVPVSMPLLQRSEPDRSPGSQEIGDPRFVLLYSMDSEELSALLEDEEKFSEVVTNMEEVKQKKLEKEMAMAENRSLAEFNLSREPRLNEGRAQLIERLHEAQKIRDSYIMGKAKLESVREQTSLDAALALMQADTAKAEDDSEEIADDFLKGDLSVEDFIEKFMPMRQTAHLRHIKAEKMQEILNKQGRGQTATSSAPQGATSQHSSMPPYGQPHHAPPSMSHYPHNTHGAPPYSYQPQRPAPRLPYQGPNYGPGAPPRMPTLGSYPH